MGANDAQINLFPVTVTAAGVEYREARLWVTPTRAELWVAPAGRPTMERTASVTEPRVIAPADVSRLIGRQVDTLITDDDGTWEVERTGGCGCGHVLRNFDPSSVSR